MLLVKNQFAIIMIMIKKSYKFCFVAWHNEENIMPFQRTNTKLIINQKCMHIEFVSNFITLSLVVQQYLMRLLNNFYGKKEKEKEMFKILVTLS